MTKKLPDYDDVGEAFREGRPLRAADGYRILCASYDLNFRHLIVRDPVPLGCQILESAGLDPQKGFSLYAILPNGDFEDVRLDEPFDLRGRGAERFVTFDTDRTFKLTLNNHQLVWGTPSIAGSALYTLANANAEEAVFREVRGGTDHLVEPSDTIDLTAAGIEQFITAPKPPQTYEITVNARPRIVNAKRVTFEQVVLLAFPGAHAPNIVFSMTYRHAASAPHAGELAAGGSVEVKKQGTIFNVTSCVQS
jgi:hypothetical protein